MNLEYGAALQTGFKYALGEGCQDVVQMDADGQHDPAYIIPFLKAVQSGGVDVAIGSRFMGESDYSPVPGVAGGSLLMHNKLRAYSNSISRI